MSTLRVVEMALEVWGVIFCLIASGCIYLGKKIERKENVALGYMLAMTSVLLVMDAGSMFCDGRAGRSAHTIHSICVFGVYLCTYILIYGAARYTEALINGRGGYVSPVYARLVLSMVLVMAVFLTGNAHAGFFYYLDEYNRYRRGDWFLVSQLPGVVIMIMIIAILLFQGEVLSRLEQVAVFAYVTFPLIAAVLQWRFYGLNILNTTMTISMLVMFAVYEIGRSRRMIAQAEVLVEQEKLRHEWEMGVFRAQLEPHFIYNCMNVIQFLCRKDPVLAAEAIRKFSLFLRNSIDLYDKTECISLDDEIYIVNNYLYLEKLRFTERLQVNKNLEVTDFKVPPLVVQTLVENAIKHGLCQKREGGTVEINTYDKDDCHIIEVRDDGVGFDEEEVQNDGDMHVGMDNVRRRLEDLCDGRLVIRTAIGVGTTATIYIPIQHSSQLDEGTLATSAHRRG